MGLTRNGAAVLGALDQPRSLTEIIMTTGLTDGQVRYALTQLIAAGEAVMVGSQGVRGTTYARDGER
jgi:ATP-dependent DNA helicase RecG